MQSKPSVSRVLAACVIGLAGLTAAQAAVVDPFQLDGSGQSFAVRSPNGIEGQSFTTGISGRLVGLELLLGARGDGPDLQVSIVDMRGGDIVSAPALATVTLTGADLGPLPPALELNTVTGTLIDFSAFDIPVAVGDLLGFRLTTERDLPNFFIVGLSLSDPYAAGAFFENNAVSPDKDAAFKVFVEAAPIPEPTSLALICIGLGGIWYGRRRGTSLR